MNRFHHQIRPAHPSPKDIATRRWLYIPYDRLTDRTGPIAQQAADETGIVIVESAAKPNRRPYHKKKLVLLLSNMRHFALEQAARGVSVVFHFSPNDPGTALLEAQRECKLPTLTTTQPAERELRIDLEGAIANGLQLDIVPDTTWLSTTDDFTGVFGPYRAGRPYVMDRFYRRMRQQTGILMHAGKPIGGSFSYDAENRKPYKGQPPIPTPPVFPPDSITEEVIALVDRNFPSHFGTTADFCLPTTQTDCDAMWAYALQHLLPHFGPYEDAMRADHLQLFHSKTSALINLGRLLPATLINDVEQAAQTSRIPLASAEGFIRQLLGWREFMRHLHQQTDGYRLLSPVAGAGGSVGTSGKLPSLDDTLPLAAANSRLPPEHQGARPNALNATLPLPAVYWGTKSGLHCIDTVVAQVIDEGWSHHITRLMILSNLATLCGFSPRELTDWFWLAYIDAYDWVVETNVLGMSTYADGGLTATKPYVSGAAYIHKMSNYCTHCQYDPKRSTGEGSCPFTALYWTFLERNQQVLGNNFRLQMPYTTLRKKSSDELVQLRARAVEAVAHLQAQTYPEIQVNNSPSPGPTSLPPK
jgi:deoxyribodipyrimidine photolyase-related protein